MNGLVLALVFAAVGILFAFKETSNELIFYLVGIALGAFMQFVGTSLFVPLLRRAMQPKAVALLLIVCLCLCASFASACPVQTSAVVLAPAVVATNYAAVDQCGNQLQANLAAPVVQYPSYAVPSVAVLATPVVFEQVNVHHAHRVQRRSVSVTRTVVRH